MCRDIDHELTSGELVYPELYVVQGGYKAFFTAFPELCTPRSYLVGASLSKAVAMHAAHM